MEQTHTPIYNRIGKDIENMDLLKSVGDSVSTLTNLKSDIGPFRFSTQCISDNVVKMVSSIKYPENLSLKESKEVLLAKTQGVMKFLSFFTPEISFWSILILISLFAFLQLFYLVPSRPCYYTILAGTVAVALSHIIFGSLSITDLVIILVFAVALILMILSRTVFLYFWGIIFMLSSSFSLVHNALQGDYINFLFLAVTVASFLLLFYHKRWVNKIKSKTYRAVALQGLFIVFMLVAFASIMGPMGFVLDLLKKNISTLEDTIRNLKSASDVGSDSSIKLETYINVDSNDIKKIFNGSIYHMINALSPFFKVASILTGFTMGTILHLVREGYIFPKESLI